MSPDELQSLDVDALLQLRQQIDKLLTEKREQLAAMLAKIDGDLKLSQAAHTTTRRTGGPTEEKEQRICPSIPEQARSEPDVGRPRIDAALDARGDEGHQALEGRFSDFSSLNHYPSWIKLLSQSQLCIERRPRRRRDPLVP